MCSSDLVVRRDPMAMLPFCGYNMGDYFQHWLRMQHKLLLPPKVFMVNWFRQDEGRFLWPGFGENMRVLKWIVDRARGRIGGMETVIGWVPRVGDLDLQGLSVSEDDVDLATRVDYHEWRVELESQLPFFAQFGERIPRSLLLWRELLLARLNGLPS